MNLLAMSITSWIFFFVLFISAMIVNKKHNGSIIVEGIAAVAIITMIAAMMLTVFWSATL